VVIVAVARVVVDNGMDGGMVGGGESDGGAVRGQWAAAGGGHGPGLHWITILYRNIVRYLTYDTYTPRELSFPPTYFTCTDIQRVLYKKERARLDANMQTNFPPPLIIMWMTVRISIIIIISFTQIPNRQTGFTTLSTCELLRIH